MRDFNTTPKNELLKSKQEICKKEGISNYEIKYTDNTKTIDLIDKNKKIKWSIFILLKRLFINININ